MAGRFLLDPDPFSWRVVCATTISTKTDAQARALDLNQVRRFIG
jgi:hypothetical protein